MVGDLVGHRAQQGLPPCALLGVDYPHHIALLRRNLRSLAAFHRLLGEHMRRRAEFPGVLGSWVERVSDPWLNTLVPDGPEVDLSAALGALEHTGISVFTCSPVQAEAAVAAGFGELVARQPAMGLDFPVEGEAPAGIDAGVDLAALGALSDVAYGNTRSELEHTLHRFRRVRCTPTGGAARTGRCSRPGSCTTATMTARCSTWPRCPRPGAPATPRGSCAGRWPTRPRAGPVRRR